MDETLNEKLAEISTDPGVYLMKDNAGRVIYVGKAKNLKKRLAAYFKPPEQMDMKTGVLVKKIADFDTILTGTETEALMLESNLIKRYRPRYNVILKDDKRYPSLRIDIKSEYPGIEVVRKIENDGALYFGPFTSPTAMYRTLKFIHKTFKLRKCRKRTLPRRTRPCLNCQMDGCLGPCCRSVDKAVYDEVVREVVLLLKGRAPELIRKIREEMNAAAAEQDFEQAAELRDKMFALEKVVEKQSVVTTDFEDRDVLGIARAPDHAVMTLLTVRNGFLIGSRHFHFSDILSSDEEMVRAFIHQYYETDHFIPRALLTPVPLEDEDLVAEWLRERKGRKVNLLHPRRGEKVRLLEMASRNAEDELREWTAAASASRDLLTRIRKCLRMEHLPERIECFDNSNISGTTPVAAMVVFEKGKPRKADYRRYTIRTVTEPDDYATMAEVLKRRYGKTDMPYPDLLMVDGGKGQLNVAVAVMKELGIEGRFTVIGIAKKDERLGETDDKIYLPGRANPVNFSRDRDALFLLQRIRDEAHRFAITFHRKRRRKSSLGSVLDGIPGIGRERKKSLLNHFGSVRRIRAAAVEELAAVPGISQQMAETIRRNLDQMSG